MSTYYFTENNKKIYFENFVIYTQSFLYAIIGSATNRVKMVSFPILTDELVPNIKNIAYNKIYAQKNIQKQYNKFQISDL